MQSFQILSEQIKGGRGGKEKGEQEEHEFELVKGEICRVSTPFSTLSPRASCGEHVWGQHVLSRRVRHGSQEEPEPGGTRRGGGCKAKRTTDVQVQGSSGFWWVGWGMGMDAQQGGGREGGKGTTIKSTDLKHRRKANKAEFLVPRTGPGCRILRSAKGRERENKEGRYVWYTKHYSITQRACVRMIIQHSTDAWCMCGCGCGCLCVCACVRACTFPTDDMNRRIMIARLAQSNLEVSCHQ